MQFPFAFLGEDAALTLSLPTFTPSGGTGFTFPLDVTISVQSPATHFRYTINDENIDENTGTLVNATSGVVTLASHDVLRAIALDAANRGSGIEIDAYVAGPHHGGGGGPPGVYP